MKFRLLMTLFFIPWLSYADHLPFDLPKALITPYGALAPKCMLKFVSEGAATAQINLKQDRCVKYQAPYDKLMLKKGWLGYQLTPKKDEPPLMRLPSIYYRYIGQYSTKPQTFLFLLYWSGGGSGVFSDLVELKLLNHKLTLVKQIAGGDRCFGGLKNVEFRDRVLSYQVNATALGLLDPQNKYGSQYRFIEDCAICCLGHFVIKGDKPQGFQFSGYMPYAANTNKPQQCYNQVLESFGAPKKKYISHQEVDKFRQQVRTNCFE